MPCCAAWLTVTKPGFMPKPNQVGPVVEQSQTVTIPRNPGVHDCFHDGKGPAHQLALGCYFKRNVQPSSFPQGCYYKIYLEPQGHYLKSLS